MRSSSEPRSPLTGKIELRASECGTKCANYWRCYNPTGRQFVHTPTHPCVYTPVKLSREEVQKRMASTPYALQTAGEHTNAALKKNGFTRRSFVKLLKVQQTAGMQSSGITLKENVFITNGIKCRNMMIKPNGVPANLSPEEQHLDACRPWLQIQMALVKPQTVLAMGAKALYSLKQKRKIAMVKECGPESGNTAQVDVEYGEKAWVVLHPAFWMRFGSEEHPAYIGKLDKDFGHIHAFLKEQAHARVVTE